MTTPSTPYRISHTLTGAIVPLLYDWQIEAASDLLVTLVNTSVTPNVETTLVLGADYAVSNVGAAQGNVTPTQAYTSGWQIVITNNIPYSQTVGFTNQNSVKPVAAEQMADRLSKQIKQIVETLARCIKTTVGSSIVPDDLLNNLLVYTGLAQTAATTATTQAGIATTQAGLASASATAAQNAVDGIPYRDVVFITSANSPYAINNTNRGKLIVVDTSGGNVIINLATIAGLTMPFTIGIKKSTTDSNTVTVNRSGTDLIDAATSYLINNVSGVNLVADTDPTPDRWTSAAFGATVGQTLTQTFLSGTHFTAGTTTTLTLTNSPIAPSSASLDVFFDGIYQHPSEYSYNPTTGVITFTSAIPVGVAQVFTKWASTNIAIGTPSAGTVDFAKMASSAVALLADVVAKVQQKFVTSDVLNDYVSPWIAFTPSSYQGLGTPTGVECFYRRVGDTLEGRVNLIVGTVTAVEARIGLPTGLTTANNTKIPTSLQYVGEAVRNPAAAALWTVLAEASKTYVTLGMQSSTSAGAVKQNGNTIFNAGDFVSFKFSVPIQGW